MGSRHLTSGDNFTETYVNLPSLVTGSTPSRHGMIANYYLDPNVDPRERFEGSSGRCHVNHRVIPTAQNSDSQGIPFLGWM